MTRSWEAFQFKGAPVRLHYSVLFLIPLHFLLSSMPYEYAPVFAVFLLFLILAHEMGHAYVAYILKVKVFTIDVYFMFGTCQHAITFSRLSEILIAWGGVLAQLVLLVIALLVMEFLPVLQQVMGLDHNAYAFFKLFSKVFIGLNVLIIAINLVPARGLDGFVVWEILPYLRNYLFKRKKLSSIKSRAPTLDRRQREADAKRETEEIIVKLSQYKKNKK